LQLRDFRVYKAFKVSRGYKEFKEYNTFLI